ncbi:MAG: twin arginine-targeting protein translocase TatB [Rhodocyclales bacterium GWA2_65_20]|nr:MAG: twin arginine-targeting protein translocase TatB [Rhodocyclales bacterium GWA2_65_20]
MFDIAFSELVIIALVALVVVGPERLPKVARTAGILLGRLQRYVSDVKADIHREIQIDELKKMQDDVATQVRSMEQSVSEQMKTVETELNQSIAAGIEEKSAVAAEAAAPQAESAAVLPAAAEAAPPAADAIVATATEKPHA